MTVVVRRNFSNGNSSMTKEIKNDTSQLRDDSAAIKQDTSEILQEIARLRAQLPDGQATLLPTTQASNSTLARYLDDLTSYAETVCWSGEDSDTDVEKDDAVPRPKSKSISPMISAVSAPSLSPIPAKPSPLETCLTEVGSPTTPVSKPYSSEQDSTASSSTQIVSSRFWDRLHSSPPRTDLVLSTSAAEDLNTINLFSRPASAPSQPDLASDEKRGVDPMATPHSKVSRSANSPKPTSVSRHKHSPLDAVSEVSVNEIVRKPMIDATHQERQGQAQSNAMQSSPTPPLTYLDPSKGTSNSGRSSSDPTLAGLKGSIPNISNLAETGPSSTPTNIKTQETITAKTSRQPVSSKVPILYRVKAI